MFDVEHFQWTNRKLNAKCFLISMLISTAHSQWIVWQWIHVKFQITRNWMNSGCMQPNKYFCSCKVFNFMGFHKFDLTMNVLVIFSEHTVFSKCIIIAVFIINLLVNKVENSWNFMIKLLNIQFSKFIYLQFRHVMLLTW